MAGTLQRIEHKLDAFQQRHPAMAFPYAVIKKYSDDHGGQQAALLAYYGFISLFPLLIVAVSVIQLITQNNAHLREIFLTNAASYFPSLGQSLVDSINTPSKSGISLVVAALVTLYGARGVAMAIQHAQNHVWSVTRPARATFPKSMLKSFGIIFWGGLGFILAASLTGYAAGSSHPLAFRLLLGLGGFSVLFAVFWGVFTFGSSARRHPFANVPGALFAATGLLILQAVGGYLVSHQLRTKTGLNAQFAIVLALLFWLYLQAMVFVYALEINTVRKEKLWPRSLGGTRTEADKRAYAFYKQREIFE